MLTVRGERILMKKLTELFLLVAYGVWWFGSGLDDTIFRMLRSLG